MKRAQIIEALSGFENDLLGIINGLTFHRNKNLFQKSLDNNKDMYKSGKIYVKFNYTGKNFISYLPRIMTP